MHRASCAYFPRAAAEAGFGSYLLCDIVGAFTVSTGRTEAFVDGFAALRDPAAM